MMKRGFDLRQGDQMISEQVGQTVAHTFIVSKFLYMYLFL
jgi:hypothetical protein